MDRIIEFAFSRHDLLVLRLWVVTAEGVGVGPGANVGSLNLLGVYQNVDWKIGGLRQVM
jgi:hypothetical protein